MYWCPYCFSVSRKLLNFEKRAPAQKEMLFLLLVQPSSHSNIISLSVFLDLKGINWSRTVDNYSWPMPIINITCWSQRKFILATKPRAAELTGPSGQSNRKQDLTYFSKLTDNFKERDSNGSLKKNEGKRFCQIQSR